MTLKNNFRAHCEYVPSDINLKFTPKLILGIIFVFFVISACSNIDEKKAIFLKEGRSYLDHYDYRMARIQFKRALRIDPNLAAAYYNLGLIEVQLGNAKQALSNFLHAIELNPEHIDTQIQIGLLMLSARSPYKATQRADIVLANEKNHQKALRLKAAALLELDNDEDNLRMAAQIFERLLRSGHTSAEIYYQSARALLHQKNLVQAQVRVTEGLTQHPHDYRLNELLAKIYVQLGENKDAIDTYQKLMTMASDNPDYLFELADLLWVTHQTQKSQKLLARHILPIGTKDAAVWLRLSEFYRQKNKLTLSYKALTTGLSIHPHHFELHLAIARKLIEKKDYLSAIKHLKPGLIRSEKDAGSNLKDAKLLISKCFLAIGELAQAEQYSDEYLESHPQSQKARFIQGMIDLLNDAPCKAAATFLSILEANPFNDAARIQLAHAMVRDDQWQKAIDILTTGTLKHKNNVSLWQALFKTYRQQKKFDQAEKQLNKILLKHPNDYSTMILQADFYRFIGDRDKAEQTYRKMIGVFPEDPSSYLQLSQLYTQDNKFDMATRQLENGLAMHPKSDEILLALTKIYLKRGKYDLVLKMAMKKIKESPHDAQAFMLTGKVYAAVREYGKSETAFLKAIDAKPNSAEAQIELMELWYRQNEKQKIVKYFNSLIKARPNSIASHAALAAFYLKEHAYLKAIEFYESALDRNPEKFLWTLEMVQLMCSHPRNNKDNSNAIVFAKKSLQHHPDNPLVLDALGWAYYHSGNVNQARGYLYQALNLAPNQPTIYFHLAKVSLGTGQYKKAADALEKALAINENFSEKKEALKILKNLRLKNRFQS
jgi:putative PEP-CTERM system TPR-repeat lipoprotein